MQEPGERGEAEEMDYYFEGDDGAFGHGWLGLV